MVMPTKWLLLLLQTWLMSTSDLRRSMPRARSEIFAGSCSYLGLGLGLGLGIEGSGWGQG